MKWLIGKLIDIGFGGVVDRAFDYAEKRADNETERERIRANMTIEEGRNFVAAYRADRKAAMDFYRQGTERQKAKFNFPVFWVLIAATIGAPVLHLAWLTAYNIFFWENGIWPQDFAIAAYPPQSARWVDMSFEWLFDPVNVSASVGSSALAGKLAT